MRELSQKVIAGGFWVFGLQFFQRGLALLRTLILARILAPEDFGLFALASLMILAFEVFTRTGFEDALIHFRDDLDSYLHTSYWIQVLRGFLLALLCLLLAPLLGSIFHEPTVVGVARFMALTQLIRGFRSVGIVLLQRELNFKKETQFNLVFVIVSFISTIGFSLILKSVWGMVFGFFVGELAATIMSFYFHPYRPRFEFRWQNAKSLWNYGIWLFLSGIVSYMALNLDKIFIGHLLDTEALGYYYMAFFLANLATVEFTKVVCKISQPAYATLQNDTAKMTKAFAATMKYTFLFVAPAAIGLMIIAPKFAPLILGENWGPAGMPISLLILGGLFRSVAGLGGALFKAVGDARPILTIETLRALALFCLLYLLSSQASINTIAIASTSAAFLVFPVTLYYINRKIGNFREWLPQLLSPMLGVFAMGLIIYICSRFSNSDWQGLLLIILAASIFYAIMMFASGKPLLAAVNNRTKLNGFSD